MPEKIRYYEEIKNIIEEREANKKVREIKDNREDLLSRWNIGRLIVEAQGGSERAKYGTALIKEWGKEFSEKYGENYNSRNLFNYKKFFTLFPIVNALRSQLNWTHYRSIISLKNENERNYYVNQVIINHLSTRELEEIIKSKSYDRLSYKDKNNIELIEDNNYSLTIEDMIKDPILIKSYKEINTLNEKMLHKYIIDMLEERFLELGAGFTLAGHEYKLIIDNRVYKIDLLFFNVKLNSYVVVEVKIREIKKEDISQLQFYVNYIDRNIKSIEENATVGIIICKHDNDYVIEFCSDKRIIARSYEVI